MKEEIKKNLDNLKAELDKLSPAIEHLQIADKNANSLISAFRTLHSVYESHLQKIERLFLISNKEHQNQISSVIDAPAQKLDEIGDKISKSFKGLEKDIAGFLDNHVYLTLETEKLTAKIN